MKTRHLFLIIGLLFHNYAYSQVYVFMVCGSRGENAVKTNGEWKLLKTMSTIDKFDEIKTVGDHCYLGLIHTSGRSITIRQAGTFSAADLLKRVNTGNTAVASKYADFVYSKLTTVGSVPSDNKHRSADDKTINIFLPNSAERFGSDEWISWSPMEGVKAYKVKLKSMFAESIVEYTSEKPFMKINFGEPLLQNQKVVFLSVESSDDPGIHSEDHEIIKIAGDKTGDITDDFSKVKSDIGEETSLNDLILASFFEDRNLLIDAASYYQSAVQRSPDISDFQNLFDQFLSRNGLK
jgi:hypothetical protein